MKVSLLIPLCLSLSYSALSPALTSAQSVESATKTHYSHAELNRQIQTARTVQQYQALADYFRQQETSFRLKAASEKSIWEARAQSTSGSGEKYPRPVDSAHYRYDSYSYEADRSGKLADHYEQLARPTDTSAAP